MVPSVFTLKFLAANFIFMAAVLSIFFQTSPKYEFPDKFNQHGALQIQVYLIKNPQPPLL